MPRRKVNVKQEILKALDCKSMNWLGLLRETKVSRGALSRHLNLLIKSKVILTKIKESRPPQTLYYLAEQPIINLYLFMVEGMTQEQVNSFFNDVLTVKTYEVLMESYNKISDLMQLESFKMPITKVFSINEEEDIHAIEERLEHSPQSLTLWQLLNVDIESMDEQELQAWQSTVFSQIAVQFILTIYEVERKFFDVFPDELRAKIKRKGALKNTLVLKLIEKRDAWEEFDNFSKWWYKKITPKILSSRLLGYLALKFYTDIYAPNLETSPSP